MSSSKKRAYNSAGRNARAIETRARILESAKGLFRSKGFEFVTIERLAESAGVSASTIYSLFRSKRGVLRALIDEAMPQSEYEALVAEVNVERSAKKRLMIAARISRRMYDAERALMDIFRSAAVLAPEFRELEEEIEQRRYRRQGPSTKVMAEEGVLAEGLSLAKARDILWAFTGRDMYRMMVIDRGWTSDAYEKWLAEVLINLLLGKEGG